MDTQNNILKKIFLYIITIFILILIIGLYFYNIYINNQPKIDNNQLIKKNKIETEIQKRNKLNELLQKKDIEKKNTFNKILETKQNKKLEELLLK